MSLTKATYSMIQGSLVHVVDYGATGDGTTNDTAAIQAAFDAASAISGGISHATVVFANGANYLISAKLTATDISIEGNGSSLVSNTAITMLEINGNTQVFSNLFVRFSSEQSNSSAIAIKLTDGTLQASKNTFVNVITRNAYHGFYNNGGLASAGSIWGSVFINCRADYCYDWAWYIDGAVGATTCTFINCHALAASSSNQAKGYYINNIADVVMNNCAADQMDDGQCLNILTALSVSIDTFAMESVNVTSASQHLVQVSANNNVQIGAIRNASCTYAVGGGNNAYILKISSGTNVNVGNILDVTPTITSGTVYKMRTSSTTRVQTNNIPLSAVDTQGYYELFFDFTRFKGLASATPAGSWTGTYEVGDIAWNRLPTAGGVEPIGWVCTVAGTPGTWAAFGTIA
jgi:hypothetical protein